MAIQIKRKLGQPTSDDLDGLLEGQPLIDLSSGDLYIGGSEKRVGESLVEEERSERTAADSALQIAINTEKSARESADNELSTRIEEDISTQINSLHSIIEEDISVSIEEEKSARQTFESSHDNIENAVGIDSIIQKYSGEQDATHDVNTNTGESSAVFGELNSNTKNRTLVSGKMNISNASNSIIGGLGNGRNNVTSGNPAEGKAHTPQLYGSNLIVGGLLNHSFTYGDGKSAQNSIISGQSNILDGGNNCLIVGLENRTYRDHRYPDQNIIGGNSNKVYSMASLVVGHNNVAKSSSAIIAGYFNEGKENVLLELGNGTSSAPSNAFEVQNDGSVIAKGSIYSPTITNIQSTLATYRDRLDIADASITTLTNNKADKEDSISGYGITDAYTKTEVDSKISESYGNITFPVTSVAGKTGAVTLTKSDVNLGNVDNTSDATKKSDFTGSISSGSTGFVKGGDVYTELDKKADKTALEEFREYYEYMNPGLIGQTSMYENKVFGNLDSSYEGEMALVVGTVVYRQEGSSNFASALCFGLQLSNGKTSTAKAIMPDGTTQEFNCTVTTQSSGSGITVTITGPAEEVNDSYKYDVIRAGVILF